MVLIFTGNEELNKELNKKIENSRIVYYPEYILEEKETKTIIVAVQQNMFNFQEYILKIREKNIQVILLLENEKSEVLKDALLYGIYDIIFDPFEVKDIIKKIRNPTLFSEISKYIKQFIELEK